MATNIKKTSVSGRVPNTFTLSVDGDIGINTYDGRLWVSNGSVVSEIGAGTGSGTPGGSNTQIQFNDSDVFGGDAGLTYNKTTDALTVAGLLYVGANVISNTSALFVGNSSVNSILTANLLTLGGQINANGAVGTSGQVLTSGATGNVYWTTPTAVAGSNTQVQFNDSGALAGDSGFTFNKDTDALTLSGSVSVGANVIANTSALLIGNSSVNAVITSSSINVDGTLAAGNTTITGFANVSADAIIHGYTLGRGNSAHITNITFGYNALANTTTYADGVDPYSGRFNTAIGYQSLLNNGDGYDNIGIGHRTLVENTVGYDNIAIGESALSNNVTGDSNIAIGTWAQVDSQGYYNIAVGHYTMGYVAAGATYNIGIGYSIMNSLNNGARNIGFGQSSFNSLSDGYDNLAIGTRSSYRTSTGNNNVSLGYYSLYNNVTGGNNVAIGYNALYGNENSPYSSGNYNIGIGARTLYSVTTGNINIGMGVSSLERNTTGEENIAFGDGAMDYNITGSYNFAAGALALRGVTSTSANGWYNIGIGQSTMTSINQGNNNIAFGTYSLQGIANGSYSIALGFEAGQLSSATDTIAIGRQSQKFGGSGNNNIGIGANSLYSVASGANNIAIGYGAGRSVTGSNNLLLGAVAGNSSINDTIIVGTGGGTERFRVDSGGNVAIGTITASNRLQVNGAIGANQISANGSVGTAGYVLTSGASGNVYWSPLNSESTTVDSTTARTLTSSDAGTIVEFTNSSAITVTVANNATQNIPVNSTIYLVQGAAGQITISPGSGVTIDYTDSLKTRAQESIIGLKQIQIDKWQLFGDTEPTAIARSALIRSAATNGVPAFVAATADGQVLKRTSGTLGFTAVTAADVTNTPAGNIAAVTVQDAINELDTEKQPVDTQLTTIAGLTMTGNAGKALLVNDNGTDFELGTVVRDLTAVTTDVKLTNVGTGLFLKEGTDATMGVATLVAGSATVSTTKITANSRVFISTQSLGTVSVPQAIGVTARSAGTSFTITSADATDTSVVAWMIVEPYVGDPYFSSVSSLLHFNGADGSTTFTDQISRTWTVFGGAQIDTAQSKFGGASGLFDGTGDYITTPHATNINLAGGDFTIEGWFRLNAVPSASMYLIDKDGVSGSTYASYAMTVTTGRKLSGYVANGTSATVPTIFTGTTTINTGQWYHFAMTKSGSTIRIFLDGVLEASGTGSTMVDGSKTLYIGYSQGQGSGTSWNGWLDDFRITKGVARYTSAFTPPSAAFLDS